MSIICFLFEFRISHFDYVKSEDLEKIGMGRPAIRRLMDLVKKRKAAKRKNFLDKVGWIDNDTCFFFF